MKKEILKADRNAAIKGHLAMEFQLKEIINENNTLRSYIKVLKHNRDVTFDCLREVLKTNEELRKQIEAT